ncbi:hypothetical protein C8R43DRAFT_1139287 [Mycena crocata]|nr:hypothetical protein C8R43DRAFT_1139287 [Mycena crocata]
MPPAQLAQELLDTIVSDVDGKEDLKSCSLVSRSWIDFVKVRMRPAPTRCNIVLSFESARDLFAASPHLGSYVRELDLYLLASSDYSPLRIVISMLPRLTQLGMLPNGSGGSRLVWRSLPSTLTGVLSELIALRTIRSLRLTRVQGVPSSLIRYASSALWELLLCDINFTEDAPGTSAFEFNAHAPSNLRHIMMSGTDQGFNASIARSIFRIDISQQMRGVLTMSLRMDPKENQAWQRLICDPHTTTKLEHLQLSFTSHVPMSSLHLGTFRFLRLLGLALEYPGLAFPSVIRLTVAELPTSTPLLESLRITLHVPFQLQTKFQDHSAPYELFSRSQFRTHLPYLRKIQCCTSLLAHLQLGFEQYVKHLFPGPSKAGILTCTFTERTVL